MASRYERERRLAVEAVRTAAAVCRSVQRLITPDVLEKKDRSPVTVADFASQAVICRFLEREFADDPVIAEEDAGELRQPEHATFLKRVRAELGQVGIDASDDEIFRWIDRGGAHEHAPRFWTLDPIDGTKGFLRGEQYAVSLALIVGGQIEVAVLGCPNLPLDTAGDKKPGTLMFAVRGEGSWMIPLDGEPVPRSVRVSETAVPAEARFCESVESGHSAHDLSAQVAAALGIQRDGLRMDSQAKYAAVARGDAEIYMRLPTRADYVEKIWDHAGGVLILEEAGGMVTDVAGNPLEFQHGSQLAANRGVIATNGLLHERVIEALNRLREGV